MQNSTAMASTQKELMDRIYRYTRHVYDASRKYFLLGRDKLIVDLSAQPEDKICEIGCGTARNLVKMAEKYPQSHFYGIDASEEMLKTARHNLKQAKQEYFIPVKQGYAQNFGPQSLFGVSHFDKIVFSYSLSMIPPWRESIQHSLNLLPEGGEVHIVDFGQQKDLPKWFREILFWFLGLFHVRPEPDLYEFLKELEEQGQGTLEWKSRYKGYCFLARFKKPKKDDDA